MRSNTADMKVSAEGGREGGPGTGDSSAAHGEDHGEAGCPSAAH